MEQTESNIIEQYEINLESAHINALIKRKSLIESYSALHLHEQYLGCHIKSYVITT